MWRADYRLVLSLLLLLLHSGLPPAAAEEVEDLTAQGEQFQSEGNDLKAIECFSKAIRLAPNNGELYRRRGYSELIFNLCWDDRCIADYTHALRIDPDDYEALCWRGLCLMSISKHRALSDFSHAREVLKKLPDSAQVLKYRALAQFFQDIKAGYNELKLWRDKYPDDDIEPNFYLCCNAFNRDNAQEAKEFGRRALQSLYKEAFIHPNSSNFRMLARAACQSGRVDESIEWLSKFLEKNPGSSHALYWRSYLMLTEKQSATALADLEKAVELQPEYLYRVNHLGDVYSQEKELTKAAHCYNRILLARPDDAKIRIKRVNCLKALKMEKIAIQELNSALLRRPMDYKLLEALSELEKPLDPSSSRQHLKQAHMALDLLLKQSPKDPELYFDRANLNKSADHIDNALADISQAIALNPEDPMLYHYRASFNWTIPSHKELSLQDETRALAIPNSRHNKAFYHHTRGSFAYSLRHMEQVMVDAKSVIELEPDWSWGYRLRGLGNLGRHNFLAALADFDQASRLRDANNDLDYLRGRAFENLHKYKEAITAYDTDLIRNPTDINCLMSRGDLLSRQESYNEAIRDFNKVLEVDSKCSDALLNRGKANACIGEYGKAIADITEAITLRNAYTDSWLLEDRARYYTYAARYREAANDMDNAFRGEPSRPNRLFLSAKLFYHAGDTRAAIERISEYLTLVPTDRKALRARARCYFETGEIDKSILDYSTIIKLVPSPEIYTLRARSYAKLGDHDSERKDLAMAKKLSVSS